LKPGHATVLGDAVLRGEPRCDVRGSPRWLLNDRCYGQACGLLLTPVHVVVSSFGSDLPGPDSCEPPFVLSLLPTGVPGNVHVEFGPAAVYVPPACAQSCAGDAAYVSGEKTRIATTSAAVKVRTNRMPSYPLRSLPQYVR
jgi:hypothetical protein